LLDRASAQREQLAAVLAAVAQGKGGSAAMLRALSIAWLIGDAIVWLVAFALSWQALEKVFEPPPGSGPSPGGWLSSVNNAVQFAWLVALCAAVALAVAGILAAGVGLAYRNSWWRPWAIVAAVTSLVALLPWLGLLPAPATALLVVFNAGIVLALALPWGDNLVHTLQRR
jgi:hypothetical protein